MRTRRFVFLTGLAVLLALSSAASAGAQERNMARLVLEDTTYVDVSMGLQGQTGRLRDIFDPEQVLAGALEASSRRKLGAVSLYGHFGYGYDYGRGSTWRGWIDPYETPFMLADSIPGALSQERFSMQAGAGLPLGSNWSVGLDLAYDVALMAKHKDLRNKNTAMNFRVAPGVQWRGESVGLGLDLGYERSTERVEYMQVSSNLEHVLFDIYGLWLYRASGFGSAEVRRFKENNRFFGDFQLGLDLGGVSLENSLGASWLLDNQSEVGYNNLQFGSTRTLTWSDELTLRIGEAHVVEASFSFSSSQGFRPLQRQELDPDSRIRVWVTCGDPVFCYWRQYHHESVRYTFGRSWKLSAGLVDWGMEHSYTEYPRRFKQHIHNMTPSLSAEIPIGNFTIVPLIGHTFSYHSYTDETEWQLVEPLRKQWDLWDGSSYLGGLDVDWISASGRTYVKAHYSVEVSTELAEEGSRHVAGLTLGFVF